MRNRKVEPEILDALDSDDPRAIQSRRALRRLNYLMRHASIFDEQLGLGRGRFAPRRVLDLGSGDGWVLYEILSRLPMSDGDREVVLVDRRPCVSTGVLGALESMGWTVRIEVADVVEWISRRWRGRRFDCCFINLMLHHFRDREIRTLFHGIQKRARSLAACEPRRSARSLLASHSVRWVGCDEVTQHDAVASVRAGFREDELTQLWPRQRSWLVQERPVGLFSHYFWAKELDL